MSDGSANGNSFQLVSVIAIKFWPVQVSFLSISASLDPFWVFFGRFLLISALFGLFCFGLGIFTSVWVASATVWAVSCDFLTYFSTVSGCVTCWCGYLAYFSTGCGFLLDVVVLQPLTALYGSLSKLLWLFAACSVLVWVSWVNCCCWYTWWLSQTLWPQNQIWLLHLLWLMLQWRLWN